MQENEYSIINRYGDNFTSKTYITNPAIGREEELKKLILVLLKVKRVKTNRSTCGYSWN